ncbi:MAG: replicative DNA helicase [Bacilli bacterium]|nr:replicative DNA helicase [Bacilli bacterium]
MNNQDPKNLEAEMNVLGCAYLSQSALDKVCDDLTEDMFYDKKNQVIFSAMKALRGRNDNIDSTILKNEIEKTTPINSIGGVEYLSDVIDSVLSSANVETYIDIIKDKYVRRKLIETCNKIQKQAVNEGTEQAELIDTAEKEIFLVAKQRKSGEFKSIDQVVKSAKIQLEEMAKNGKDITGIPTGFIDFDKMTSGLHPNELIIIAARPGMGKTAFALNLAVNAAIQSHKSVAIFNLEMSAEQLMMRMISSKGAVDGNKLRTGKLNNDDWKRVNEAMSILSEAPIYIEDTPGITIGELRAKCRRLAEKTDLGMIVIDYLQLLSGGANYGTNRQQEVSDISRNLKTMAMELGVPVIALAQLSRSVEGREDKRPMLSDLRESGSIEQDADIVSFLYRDDYYRKKSEGEKENPISLVELIVAKHRAGANGTLYLQFEKNISDFRTSVQNPENRNQE